MCESQLPAAAAVASFCSAYELVLHGYWPSCVGLGHQKTVDLLLVQQTSVEVWYDCLSVVKYMVGMLGVTTYRVLCSCDTHMCYLRVQAIHWCYLVTQLALGWRLPRLAAACVLLWQQKSVQKWVRIYR